ncbi:MULTISPECIES: DUF2934 domain-containing protein [unclassified Rhizobium]|uniref:DUF2934 domain-containing protein n=1 Tax=unclassified Rhizobium TaxID=2613769 RepID=UPI000EA8FB66|nr:MULTISPECIES: DUF2934 domain-containing protein [unclassified Rhizobium]AYG69880.1 DUF2934 domain-containing protein [Rhizobium sp. CCGE531]AYG76260.1 DUF2934 domain-containing protein [Rhizobium sp. CCGE532]
MNQSLQEEAVRLRAYQIWQDEGQPEGQELIHWRRATQEILAEDGRQPMEMDETEAVTQAPPPPQAPPVLSSEQK